MRKRAYSANFWNDLKVAVGDVSAQLPVQVGRQGVKKVGPVPIPGVESASNLKSVRVRSNSGILGLWVWKPTTGHSHFHPVWPRSGWHYIVASVLPIHYWLWKQGNMWLLWPQSLLSESTKRGKLGNIDDEAQFSVLFSAQMLGSDSVINLEWPLWENQSAENKANNGELGMWWMEHWFKSLMSYDNLVLINSWNSKEIRCPNWDSLPMGGVGGSSKLARRVFPISYFGCLVWNTATNTFIRKKRPKNKISRHKGCRLLVIEPVHRGSSSILLVSFFGTPRR